MPNIDQFGFDSIIGHDYIKACLKKLIFDDRKPGSMIFTGAAGVGKLSMAIQYALGILCQNPTEDGACGKCNSCLSYVNAMNPNICFWYRKGQMSTTIDQMRNLKTVSGFAPINNKYKINIIQSADTLNEEAANCILKIIEEPPDYLINILIYNNSSNILPTIRSRSYVVRFYPVARQQVFNYLANTYGNSEYLDFASRFAMGSIGRAITILNSSNDARELVAETVDCIRVRQFILPSLAEKIAALSFNPVDLKKKNGVDENKSDYLDYKIKIDKIVSIYDMTDDDLKSNEQGYLPKSPHQVMSSADNILFYLDMLALWLRDIISVISHPDLDDQYIINIDKLDVLQKQANYFNNIEEILEIIDIIWNAKDRISSNINMLLSVEAMLAQMSFVRK